MTTQLADGVWWLDLGGVNAYLVDDGGALTLVDAGMPWHANRVAEAIGRVGDGLHAVERVLVTHYDVDHVGGLGTLDALDAPVYVGAADAALVAGDRRPDWTSPKGLLQRATEWWRNPPAGPVHAVDDGDAIGGFRAVHTPGHTPGHTVFVHEERSLACLGDAVRETHGRLEPPPGILNSDTDEASRTVRTLVDRLDPFEVAAVGHGTPFASDGYARLQACAEALELTR